MKKESKLLPKISGLKEYKEGGSTKRSKKLREKSDVNNMKGMIAVDEGREKKANRLLKKASRQENRSINIEDRKKLLQYLTHL
tara:strand:+ start:566 stop:814 length:249 start_codon:yes stop_codon:yes gene_type:complete